MMMIRFWLWSYRSYWIVIFFMMIMIMVMKLNIAAMIWIWSRPRGWFRLNRNMVVGHCMMWRFRDRRWMTMMTMVIRRWSRCWIWPWIDITWRIVWLRCTMRMRMIIWCWSYWSIG